MSDVHKELLAGVTRQLEAALRAVEASDFSHACQLAYMASQTLESLASVQNGERMEAKP